MYRGGRYGNRGGGNSSRGGRYNKQSTQPKGLFADGVWHCNCTPRLPAEHFKVKKESPNKGKWFYTCQQSDEKRCGFFLWDEDAKLREESAVLTSRRTEPVVQSGWNAGRAREEEVADGVQGKGLFVRNERGDAQRAGRANSDTESENASPPPSYSSDPPVVNGAKRNVQEAELDDDDEFLDELARTVDGAAPETPYKAQKTGVYATPATTGKRKLPWLEQSTTPATTRLGKDCFATPSKKSANISASNVGGAEPETPATPPTPADPKSPSPPTRHKDALYNPADSASSLTSQVLTTLSSVAIPPDIRESVRSILSKHDLKAQGVVKGRDLSRLALKAKDAKIAELQARIASLEADREVERSVARMRRERAPG